MPPSVNVLERFIETICPQGFRIIQVDYGQTTFGDLRVDAARDGMQCRAVRQRGQWFIDVKRADAEEWFTLFDLNAIMGEGVAESDWTVEHQLDLLRRRLPALITLFTGPSYPDAEDSLRQLRKKRWGDRLKGR